MRKNILRTVLALLMMFSLVLTGCTRKDTVEPVPDQSLPKKESIPHRMLWTIQHYIQQGAEINAYIPPNLAITRPEEYLDTTLEEYFITGTSDPNEPLYLNDELYERAGNKGTFGALIDLELGENFVTVKQGEFEREVIINRNEPEEKETEIINYIPQDSMYPLHQGGTRVGRTVPAACTGPSGATITATLGSETITLTESGTGKEGHPVKFTGDLPISGTFTADETIKVGPITYRMKFLNEKESYESSGNVYVAGSETNIVFEVSNYVGFVHPSLEDTSVFTEIVKEGATDYLMWQGNHYFQLYSGGYIPAEMVQIVEGKDPVHNKISAISANNKHKGEIFEFTGTGKSFYDVRMVENTLEFEVHNASIDDIKFPELPRRSLFGDVEITPLERSVLFTFSFLEQENFWGYNVFFDDEHMTLEVLHKPSLSESKYTPLDGITIAIDPGHGGEDPGADGPSGNSGPKEADLNLIHAFALQNELIRLGADVQLTRTNDSYYTLDERLEMHERFQADLFISLHHNSLDEDKDANEIGGMESYYYTNISQTLAENVLHSLGETVNRNVREAKHSYYRVTLLPYSPSVLIELGFTCNPSEYEQALTPENSLETAKGIANGILTTLS